MNRCSCNKTSLQFSASQVFLVAAFSSEHWVPTWRPFGYMELAGLCAWDLYVVADFAPDIAILEIGTNDLSRCRPEVVGSAIKNLKHLLLEGYSVRVLGVCHVIPRGNSCSHSLPFPLEASFLNHYVSVVLGYFPNVFFGMTLISTILIKICIWSMVFILMLQVSICCIIVIVAPF